MTYQLTIEGPPEPVRVNCTPCGKVTDHDWLRVIPLNNKPVEDALQEMQLIRRLILCTECGNLSLKK